MTTAIKVVIDANVIVRAGVESSREAREWTEQFGGAVDAFAPDVLWPEVTNALRGYVVAERISRADAQDALRVAMTLPITLESTPRLGPAALETALDRGLSVYDASYVALARIRDATLVTADRRLAAAAPKAELIG